MIQKTSGFFVAGGALRYDAPSYVERAADRQLQKLAAAGELCYVLTTRQMGKSSLMVRTAAYLQERNIHTAIIDLTSIGKAPIDAWFLSVLDDLQAQLPIMTDVEAWWEENQALSQVKRFTKFVQEVVPKEVAGQVAIFIDEIDSMLNLDFADDFFAAIRAVYNRGASLPVERGVSFVLLGVAAPNDLIKDQTRTPFNVGRRILLDELDLEDAQVLLQGLPGESQSILERIFFWTNGHPYLTQKIGLAIAREKEKQWTDAAIDDLVKRLFLTDAAFNQESNLQFVRSRLLSSPNKKKLLLLYRKVYDGYKIQSNEQSVFQTELKLYGLLRTDDQKYLVIRNRIYRRVFDRDWIQENKPANHWRMVAIGAAILAFLAIIMTFFFLRQTQDTPEPNAVLAQAYIDGFKSTTNATLRLDNLAKLFTLGGYDEEALQLFNSLTVDEQIALFKETVMSGKGAPALISVPTKSPTASATPCANCLVLPPDILETVQSLEATRTELILEFNGVTPCSNCAPSIAELEALETVQAIQYEFATIQSLGKTRIALTKEIDSTFTPTFEPTQAIIFDSLVLQPQVLEVIRGTYTTLYETNLRQPQETTRLLEVMAAALEHADDAPSQVLRNEINIWLEARNHANNGNYAEAKTVYDIAVNFNAENPATHFERAQTSLLLGDYEVAVADLTTVWELWPERQDLILDEVNNDGELIAYLWSMSEPPPFIEFVSTVTPSVPTPPINVALIPTETVAATNSLPDPLPGLIAYSCGVDRLGEIFLYHPAEGSERRLFDQPPNSVVPSFAHDGQKIAYLSDMNGAWQIFVSNLDGTERRAITSLENNNFEPVWSPDDGRMAFVSDRSGEAQIYVMNSDGTNQQRLTFSNANEDDPTWSVNDELAFESNRNGRYDIYRMSVLDGSPQLLVSIGESSTTPVWSPDGDKIAFESRTGTTRDIWIADRDGTNLQRVTIQGSENQRPAWSPDGRFLAFHSNLDQSSESQYDIWIIEISSGKLQRITHRSDCIDAAWGWGETAIAQEPKILYSVTEVYHLGDEAELIGWPSLHGQCFTVQFEINQPEPVQYLQLEMETWGVKANNPIRLNGQEVAIVPLQGIDDQRAWTPPRSLQLPGNSLQLGSNTLEICSGPIEDDPDFPGDLDDFRFRNLQLRTSHPSSEPVILGYSVENNPIEAMRFGNGQNKIVFIGGLQGGYSPGTVDLANRLVEHFSENPEAIPDTVSFYIVADANPDIPTDPGNSSSRLNTNGVDLNRNWDCKWEKDPRIADKIVVRGGGTEPFSEPETQALRDFLLDLKPQAVVVWIARAASGLVISGGCHLDPHISDELGALYGEASRYRFISEEESKFVPGDMTNWLTDQGIPAIAVVLPEYERTDWNNNLAGIQAVLDEYK